MSIVTDLKEIAKLVQKIDNVELYRQILDSQAEAMELVEENQRLRIEVGELHEKLRVQGEIKVGKNSYWFEKDGDLDGPFCTCCWDADQALIRLVSVDSPERMLGGHRCPKCRNQMDPTPPKQST